MGIKKSFIFLFCITLTTLYTASAHADFKELYTKASQAFENRGQGDSANKCVQYVNQAIYDATSSDEHFDINILGSKCSYFVGTVLLKSDKDKLDVFQQGKRFAERAIQVYPSRSEGYYYFGINLGRWGEAYGLAKALGERHNLRRAMESVLKKTAIEDGKVVPGKEYDGYGANRTLGRMYFRLPSLAGGDTEKSEELLQEAFEKMSKTAPNSLNVVFYAETLIYNNQKAKAKKILDDLIAFEHKPEQYNANRVPETIEDIVEAKKLRSELGN